MTAVDRAIEVALLLVLAALAVGVVRPQWYRPILHPAATAQSDMEEIAAALETYRHDIGRYPTTSQGLDALVHGSQAAPLDSAWYGPYVTSTMPLDPWGRPYQYRGTTDGFQLWSNGADGRPGGAGSDSDMTLDQGAESK